MIRSVVRLLAAVLLSLAVCGGVWAAPMHNATTWNVWIGGESADHALQAQGFFPTNITIDEGDKITWTMNADFFHTVTFLSGNPAPPEPIPSGEGNLVMLNPMSQFPIGGPNYDGTTFVGSGLITAKGTNFSLTFTKAGTFGYVCLLHPGMAAQVIVQPAGSAYPMTQAQLAQQGNAEMFDKLGKANQYLQSTQLSSKANADGTTNYTVANGVGGNQASVVRFLPVDLTIKAGDSVAFPVNDPHEIHTVTFYDPAGPVPLFVDPKPQPSGPPKLIIPHGLPEGSSRVEDPKALYNSGILGPGQSYTFTFPKPGTYTYVCVIHAPQGMLGKIIVEAPGAAGGPAQLPNTGEGAANLLLPMLGGALLLVLLGALALGAWRRRAI
jgi:LPXTG-motif cell wall-anchored protein